LDEKLDVEQHTSETIHIFNILILITMCCRTYLCDCS